MIDRNLRNILPLLISSAGGPCEEIKDVAWTRLGTMKTCKMDSTVIESTEFLITSNRDETVGGFIADNNEKLEHLPSNLGEKFQNLLALEVYECSLKEITKENFKGLNQLQTLFLAFNQIETIDDDTFDYITTTEEIVLGE